MTFCIAVFRSRNETLYLANMLKNLGVPAGIINTPKEAGQACGISVRFEEQSIYRVKQCLSSKPFRAFAGFFRITQISGRIKVERLA